MVLGPLLRPDRYFERHTPGLRVGRAAAVALLVALVATASIGALGYALAEQAEGTTVTVDNENRPPDWVCEDRSEDSPLSDDCDEPRTREVAASSLVWDAVSGQLPVAFVGSFAGWLLGAVGMHGLTSLANGEGSFADSLAVAGWAQAATLPHLALLTVVFVDLAGGLDPTASEAALRSQVEAFRAGLQSPLVVLGATAATLWQGYVYYHGMHHARNVSRDDALLIALVSGVVVLVTQLS